jgi:hypothetical protein
MCRSSSVADGRWLGAGWLLLLAACSSTPAEPEPDAADLIACAVGGASELTRNCSVERSVADDVLTLVIHHEDGGFRRLTVTTDGSGVITADGADPALITVFDGEIEVAVGQDRYILPATIADHAAK